MLDGLDELATPIADSGLWDLLRALPGEVVLTCRAAVFQPARTEIAGRIGSQWRLLGLKPEEEQASFLALAFILGGMDPARAPGVVRDLNANSSLRPLAAIPLLLRLVAEAGPRLVLPATRAGFYEAATNALWERRLRDRPELLDLAPERDAALATFAASMGLDTLEARPEALRRAGAASELREALRRSGLLHFDDRRGRIACPHLTFQEFHLARALLERPFGDVLRDHWTDPRYEETLALLIALHAGEGRLDIIEAELRHFVAEARADHASHPQRLWLLGRSPLRTALHLRTRAAVRADHSACPIPLLDAPVLMRLAIASDHRVPAATLAELARDPDVEVRRWVAGNVATPPVALAKLARDPDPEVRRTVAWNDAIPPAALAELARDPDPDVRRTVARTYATPPAALAELARDPDLEVRRWVAENGATPPTALAELMYDLDLEVRPGVARNYATPPVALAELARDPDPEVRRGVAANAAAPPATLAELARDPEPEVRRRAARNDPTPPALAELARDPNPEVLAELARDPNPEVRRSLQRGDTLVASQARSHVPQRLGLPRRGRGVQGARVSPVPARSERRRRRRERQRHRAAVPDHRVRLRRVRARPDRRAHPRHQAGAEGTGEYLGGKVPFGFTDDADRRLVPVPDQQRALRRIKKLAANGLSPYRISAALADDGVKLSHVTVRKIIGGRPGCAS